MKSILFFCFPMMALAGMTTVFSSCAKEEKVAKPSPAEAAPAGTTALEPKPTPPSPPTDKERAAALWTKIAGYKTWASPPDLDGIVDGESVHGDFVRFYGNGKAIANIASLPPGSILVKEGYDKKDGPLKGITAMEKIAGFNEKAGDWLFVKYSASGKASNINSSSCARCHKKADGGDFSYAND